MGGQYSGQTTVFERFSAFLEHLGGLTGPNTLLITFPWHFSSIFTDFKGVLEFNGVSVPIAERRSFIY